MKTATRYLVLIVNLLFANQLKAQDSATTLENIDIPSENAYKYLEKVVTDTPKKEDPIVNWGELEEVPVEAEKISFIDQLTNIEEAKLAVAIKRYRPYLMKIDASKEYKKSIETDLIYHCYADVPNIWFNMLGVSAFHVKPIEQNKPFSALDIYFNKKVSANNRSFYVSVDPIYDSKLTESNVLSKQEVATIEKGTDSVNQQYANTHFDKPKSSPAAEEAVAMVLALFEQALTKDKDVLETIKENVKAEYNYFISSKEAWLRNNEFPYKFLDPVQKAELGLQVKVLGNLKDDKENQVVSVLVKGSGDTILLSNIDGYISKVTKLKDEEEYVFAKDYKALNLPYSKLNSKKEYKKYTKASFHKECGSYLKVNDKTTSDEIEGNWVSKDMLRTPVSEKEIKLIENYSSTMSSGVKEDYLGFVEDFKKDGYFTGEKEPLTWLEESGVNENEVTFLGMKVTKIISVFKEVLEETEKNLKNDYPNAYSEILSQYVSSAALQGQAQIRYISNSCMCNPSNHSLGAAIDIRSALNPQITSSDKAYVTFVSYLTGLDLTKPKTAKQVTDAQEMFMRKIHGQKTTKYTLKQIIDDYKLTQALKQEFNLLAKLKDQDLEIENFQNKKEDLITILNAHKDRVIFNLDGKNAIEEMITYLQTIQDNIISKKTITNWDKVVTEKTAFLQMVKEAGFEGWDAFIKYFGNSKGQLSYHNKLLENGFGETRIELINSFHKAHRTISEKYNNLAEEGEWGGSYRRKYDGMHFGLKTSFMKSLTNKQ